METLKSLQSHIIPSHTIHEARTQLFVSSDPQSMVRMTECVVCYAELGCPCWPCIVIVRPEVSYDWDWLWVLALETLSNIRFTERLQGTGGNLYIYKLESCALAKGVQCQFKQNMHNDMPWCKIGIDYNVISGLLISKNAYCIITLYDYLCYCSTLDMCPS